MQILLLTKAAQSLAEFHKYEIAYTATCSTIVISWQAHHMDNCACGNVSPDKRVQWADNLEEVRYFVPPNRLRKSFKKKMTKIRRKASEITDKPLRIITSMGELSANAVQNGLEFILRHGQSGSFDADRVTYEDLIKEWDKLFEINAASNEESTDEEDEEKLK